jgi:hypothetical protein
VNAAAAAPAAAPATTCAFGEYFRSLFSYKKKSAIRVMTKNGM